MCLRQSFGYKYMSIPASVISRGTILTIHPLDCISAVGEQFYEFCWNRILSMCCVGPGTSSEV
jgi:hypothetical protein